MATGYVTTYLSDFKNADPNVLLRDVILTGKGLKNYFKPEFGVKYQKVVERLASAAVDPSSGDNTGYITGSGGATYKDVTLWAQRITGREMYKPTDIDEKVMGLIKPGQDVADPNAIPKKDLLMQTKAGNLATWIEKFMVQADTSTTVQTAGSVMNLQDGLLAQVRGVAGAYTTRSGWDFNEAGATDTSILNHIENFKNKLNTVFPQWIREETILLLSPANHSRLLSALYGTNGKIDANTLNADGNIPEEFYLPGTKIKAVNSVGFDQKNQQVLTHPTNIIPCYDLASEDEKLTFKFSDDADVWFLKYRFKVGLKVVDPSNCILAS